MALLNGIRHEHGLSALTGSIALQHAARSHSSDMLERGYFEHDSPNEAFCTRVRRFLDSPLVGENIAWGTGQLSTPRSIVRAWMHSPGHRANILQRSFRQIGIGISVGAPVTASSRSAATYTTDFGMRG